VTNATAMQHMEMDVYLAAPDFDDYDEEEINPNVGLVQNALEQSMDEPMQTHLVEPNLEGVDTEYTSHDGMGGDGMGGAGNDGMQGVTNDDDNHMEDGDNNENTSGPTDGDISGGHDDEMGVDHDEMRAGDGNEIEATFDLVDMELIQTLKH
jgi:hypothetical protein